MTTWRERIPTAERTGILISLGSVAGALGVASCCALPLAFAALGLGGAWLAGLSVLAPYQPILLATTAALLGAGFLVVYRRPAACAPGAGCTGSGSTRLAKIALWTAAALALVGMLAG